SVVAAAGPRARPRPAPRSRAVVQHERGRSPPPRPAPAGAHRGRRHLPGQPGPALPPSLVRGRARALRAPAPAEPRSLRGLPARRGSSTGGMFYVTPSGRIAASILIRSAVVAGATPTFHAGRGIVADSAPAFEYAETLHKAEGMRRAIEAVLA